jgi:hypothetical protein
MPGIKRASKQNRKTKAAAVTALGAAGLSFSLMGNSTSASTLPAADISDNTSPSRRFVLSEEEMNDVSLATFHLFDRENVEGGVQLARGGCGGCHGCGGCRGCGGGCRGCAGCRGCGCGFGGCAGCVGCVGFVGCVGCVACAGCCLSWGACRLC